MPARSFVGSRTWVDALLILSAFKAVKPSPEKMEAGLSPFFIKYSFTSKESIQML